MIISIVSPIGCQKDQFKTIIEKQFKRKNHIVISISVTDLLFNDKESGVNYALKIYSKMQICNELRNKNRGFIAVKIIEAIKSNRKKNVGIIYLVDQIKNIAENEVLSHVYGKNYIQISLFSSCKNRDFCISKEIEDETDNTILKSSKFCKKLESILEGLIKHELTNDFYKNILKGYEKYIMPDCSHNLIKKDFKDTDEDYKKSGQFVCEIFHKSHYFFDLDKGKTRTEEEVDKFINLLFGNYEKFPTPDEYGMSLAYQASFRSNFPGERQIGAAIVAEDGEVVSVGSIRAPASTSSPSHLDLDSISEGYDRHKLYIRKQTDMLGKIKKHKSIGVEYRKIIENVIKALEDSIEFHPCTHAELSAIIDAAKLGVSVKNATLYTTTFPCHICAKDIITAGLRRVVFIEAYPKSKTPDLYPNIISLNGNKQDGIILFEIFFGVSPSRYHYVYANKNRPNRLQKERFKEDKITYLEYDAPSYYKDRENDIINYYKNKNPEFLYSLLVGINKK